MSEEEKYNDIEQLMYRELSPNRYCYIHNYIIDLKSQLQQKENIIKEVRGFIEDRQEDINNGGNEHEYRVNKHILEILDKESKDIELDMLKALNTDLDDDVEMG